MDLAPRHSPLRAQMSERAPRSRQYTCGPPRNFLHNMAKRCTCDEAQRWLQVESELVQEQVESQGGQEQR